MQVLTTALHPVGRCGDGALEAMLQARGLRVHAIDLDVISDPEVYASLPRFCSSVTRMQVLTTTPRVRPDALFHSPIPQPSSTFHSPLPQSTAIFHSPLPQPSSTSHSPLPHSTGDARAARRPLQHPTALAECDLLLLGAECALARVPGRIPAGETPPLTPPLLPPYPPPCTPRSPP